MKKIPKHRKERPPALPQEPSPAAYSDGWPVLDFSPFRASVRSSRPVRSWPHSPGAGALGAVGGIVGALVGMGIPEYEAKRYEGRVKHGGILLSVHCDDHDWVKTRRRDSETHRRGRRLLDERSPCGLCRFGQADAAHARSRSSKKRWPYGNVPRLPPILNDTAEIDLNALNRPRTRAAGGQTRLDV